MVIDTSAVIAILFDEPGGCRFSEAIEAARTRLMSAVTRVELSFVIESRKRAAGRVRLERYLDLAEIEVMPVTSGQAMTAIEAFHRYGKGQGHPARLKIGDCFSCAHAITTDQPLLFKGGDFTATDVRSAMAA